jgi:hypothetical protein
MTTTRLALLVTASAIALGGCGGSSNHKPTDTAAAVATAAQTTNTAAGTNTGATTSTTKVASTNTRATASTGATTNTGATTKPTKAATSNTGATTSPTKAAAKRKPQPIRNVIIKEAIQYAKADKGPVPPVAGAVPATGFMASCMTSNGFGQPLLLQANEWRAVVALKQAPVFIEGPYLSDSQAQVAAASLNGVETVAAGGLYVVSALLHYHLDADVNALATCLGKAGDAPSGQKPIPKLPGT